MSRFYEKNLMVATSLFIALIASLQFSSQTANATVELKCPLFTFDLEPSTADNFTDEEHTMTATLTENGVPVDGRTVTFNVAGVNPTIDFGTTDASGQATFTYTGVNAGLDTITATSHILCEDFDGRSFPTPVSDTATKNWIIFVIPESPIGIIALLGSSIAVLGGFLFWKKRSRGTSEGLTGLGI